MNNQQDSSYPRTYLTARHPNTILEAIRNILPYYYCHIYRVGDAEKFHSYALALNRGQKPCFLGKQSYLFNGKNNHNIKKHVTFFLIVIC